MRVHRLGTVKRYLQYGVPAVTFPEFYPFVPYNPGRKKNPHPPSFSRTPGHISE